MRSPPLLIEHALDRGNDVRRMREVLILQHGTERRNNVQTAHALDRSIQLVEQLLRDLRGDLAGVAAALDLFADDDDTVRLGNGRL